MKGLHALYTIKKFYLIQTLQNMWQTKNPEALLQGLLYRSPYGNRTRVTRMKIWCPNP
jgi:hypothetical protein